MVVPSQGKSILSTPLHQFVAQIKVEQYWLILVATKLHLQEPDGSTDGVDKYPGKLTMEQARNDSSLTWSQSIVSQLPPPYAIQLRRSLLVCDLSTSSPVRYTYHNNKRTHIESSSPNPPLVLPLLPLSRPRHL